MMASRRTHRKSRAGCRECKRRHIKCDETRPVCAGCSVKKLCCVYALGPASLPGQADQSGHLEPLAREDASGAGSRVGSARATSSRSRSPLPVSSASLTPSSQLPEQAQPRDTSPSSPVLSVPPANMAQLELFHHVCTQQVPLPLNGNNGKILSGLLEAAFSSPCLMNALLAVAALHLAHTRPSQSAYYHHQAVHFHTHALSIFNQQRPQVTPENCLSLLLFGQLTSLHMLYETTLNCDDKDDSMEPLNRFLDYMKVYRGVVLIAKEAWQALLQSKLRSIFTASAGIADCRTSSGTQTTELRSVISISRALDREQKRLCLEAIDRLQWILSPSEPDSDNTHNLGSQEARDFHSLGLVHAWPLMAREAVLGLMCNKTPEALLMLAYYGVLMHQHRHFWTYANVGPILVRTIARYLGPDWQHFMIWPLAQVSQDPAMKAA
ncbi:hypothetical protein J7T55_008144 [Diaporthe amygdali]|uniref:uncharacterized protein n=1 Tax=Phomopsis amygdali TaxID=1214568 RepID=UPI0022FEF29B|nr:uncharacterized protein J7T55_008144 [Diaporthe amygdali]KAJ0108008.1 hypothetical protein J7T55_008144 [Diaporthe amygdali]